jgi:beta-lactamase class D
MTFRNLFQKTSFVFLILIPPIFYLCLTNSGMHIRNFLSLVLLVFLGSCAETRIHNQEKWGDIFKDNGIKEGCFMMRDHSHESIYFFNKERCLQRYTPASTFKILNSLIALETSVAPDEQLIISWDSIVRRPEWNRTMNMREAFKLSNVGYYQEIARRIGFDYMQHYVDTVQYGNRRIGPEIDRFWLNDTIQISADEQLGLVKKLYFDELPFSERSQRIVRSMMLQEESPEYKLYFKTGTGRLQDSTVYWIVGFAEKIEQVKEHEKSMNKSNVRNYPYFFAQNFSVSNSDTSRNWFQIRIELMHQILRSAAVIP